MIGNFLCQFVRNRCAGAKNDFLEELCEITDMGMIRVICQVQETDRSPFTVRECYNSASPANDRNN